MELTTWRIGTVFAGLATGALIASLLTAFVVTLMMVAPFESPFIDGKFYVTSWQVSVSLISAIVLIVLCVAGILPFLLSHTKGYILGLKAARAEDLIISRFMIVCTAACQFAINLAFVSYSGDGCVGLVLCVVTAMFFGTAASICFKKQEIFRS